MAKKERFKTVYSQGTLDVVQILEDTETGVNYVFHKVGNAGGMTPLLGKDGKPVISSTADIISKERIDKAERIGKEEHIWS